MECLFKYLDSLPGDFGISLSHNKAGVYLYRYLQVGGGRHVGGGWHNQFTKPRDLLVFQAVKRNGFLKKNVLWF
jgi:hypothetical protein